MTICPSCNGPHLGGLRFQHRSICDFYQAEAQTQAADHDRFRVTHGHPVVRPATETEHLMLEALGEAGPDEKVTIRATFNGAIWHRTTTDQTQENL